MWKLNNTFLNSQWVQEETKREIKKILRHDMEIQYTKTYGTQQKRSKEKVYGDECLC